MENLLFTQNGGALIQKQIECAIAEGRHETVITGNYEIEEAVVLPSGFTVILEDCHLRLKTGVYTNVFTNSATAEMRKEYEKRDTDIHIIGRGRAILDGGEFNGLTERNWREYNIPMYKNHLILFTNLEGFSITGIHLCNQRYWSVNLTYCSSGLVRDIDILADDGVLYADGERDFDIDYRGLCAKHLPMMRNADGIDLRAGCHDILIENITGFTEDDTVALTSLPGDVTRWGAEGVCSDIYNVTIRNIKSSSWCAIIRLLNQGGMKLYNILIDGVVDTSFGSSHLNRGLFAIRIGDRRLYSTRHSTAEETYNIAVRNVFSRAVTLVDLAGAITNCTIENVFGFDGYTTKIENNAELFGLVKIEE